MKVFKIRSFLTHEILLTALDVVMKHLTSNTKVSRNYSPIKRSGDTERKQIDTVGV